MSSFNSVEVLETETSERYDSALIVAGARRRTGDIIRKAMAVGLTVPLGSRPAWEQVFGYKVALAPFLGCEGSLVTP